MGAQSMKRKLWMSLFEEKASMPYTTVKEFCKMKNVTEKSYWYFHKVLADKLEEKLYPANNDQSELPTFLEVNGSDLIAYDKKDNNTNSSVTIHSVNGISVSISEDISDTFLLRLLKAVSHV